MKKILLIMFGMFLLALPLLLAEPAYIFEKNESVNLCIDTFESDNSVADDSTDCYFSLKSPRQNILMNSSTMTFDSGGLFCINIIGGNFSSLGEYPATVRCDNGVDYAFSSFTIMITPTGEELTVAKGIIYIFLAVLIFLLFLFVLYVTIALPMENEKNNRGQTIKIIKKKYIKIALIPVTYSLFVWFLNLLLSISNNLTGRFNIYYGIFSFLFLVFLRLSWLVWVVCLVWFMFNWIRDLHWNKQIKKFGVVFK